jgi:hypothetical protein
MNRKNEKNVEAQAVDPRSAYRQSLVLRVGLLEVSDEPVFCSVKNISSSGILVRPYGRLAEGIAVSVRLGDEISIPATITSRRDGLVAIRFRQPLNLKLFCRSSRRWLLTGGGLPLSLRHIVEDA